MERMEKMQLDAMNLHETQDTGSINDSAPQHIKGKGNLFTNKGYDWSGFVVQEWQDDAACSGVDPALFDVEGRPGSERDFQITKAKSICNGCPVRAACVESASESDLYYTVRGGRDPGMTTGAKVPKYNKIAVQVEKKTGRKPVSTSFKKQEVCAKGHNDWVKYGDSNRRCNACRKEGYTKWNKARSNKSKV